MRRILDRVTVTGADKAVPPTVLSELAELYPETEWGILVSEHKTLVDGGSRRFPDMAWLQQLHSEACRCEMQLSLHLCGRWVRELCMGNWGGLIKHLGSVMDVFQRIQLNFHGHMHELDEQGFVDGLHLMSGQFNEPKRYIFQLDGTNDWIATLARDSGLCVSALHDKSGGAGRLPEEWAKPLPGIWTGYAGGLGPENVAEQLGKIEQLVDDETTWIDAETWVRTADDRFDQDKVLDFLHAASPWVERYRGVG